mmetsp:Transcript_9343/g.30972  ORF Transcript_9343/g.30972 Transcript_9343/m.30972 type:complete len:219 (+) Transcript_9343:561-1217(+)
MYKFDVRALTTYESDHTAANYGTTASHAPRLDGYHFQIEHECLIHHARLGGEDEIERALAGECGRERPNRLKTVSRVAQLLGHNDAPDAASRHPPDSLIDATNHRAVADREGQRRVQETIALECAALGLVPRLKVAPLVSDRDSRPFKDHAIARRRRQSAPDLVVLKLQPALSRCEVREEGLRLGHAIDSIQSHRTRAARRPTCAVQKAIVRDGGRHR